MTGHDEGLITIALAEADDAEREKRRTAMGEPYRTLLGHFRHEIGHHYWDLLVRDGGRLEACRAVFGDDSQDYDAALQRHYASGAPADWQDALRQRLCDRRTPGRISPRPGRTTCTSSTRWRWRRPSACSVAPQGGEHRRPRHRDRLRPLCAGAIQPLVEAWLPLTFAVNSLNRCMGTPDLYPFVLSPPAIAKLGFVHRLVREVSRDRAKP